jgi:hypothetical protein
MFSRVKTVLLEVICVPTNAFSLKKLSEPINNGYFESTVCKVYQTTSREKIRQTQ